MPRPGLWRSGSPDVFRSRRTSPYGPTSRPEDEIAAPLSFSANYSRGGTAVPVSWSPATFPARCGPGVSVAPGRKKGRQEFLCCLWYFRRRPPCVSSCGTRSPPLAGTSYDPEPGSATGWACRLPAVTPFWPARRMRGDHVVSSDSDFSGCGLTFPPSGALFRATAGGNLCLPLAAALFRGGACRRCLPRLSAEELRIVSETDATNGRRWGICMLPSARLRRR